MRLLIAAFITLLSLALSGFASVNFNGTWVLDLKASGSPEAMIRYANDDGNFVLVSCCDWRRQILKIVLELDLSVAEKFGS